MLVTLEGLDGSGKTTVWESLRGEFDAVFTREPTDSWYGEAVQRSIESPDADPLAELFLYTADHAAHLAETVRPAIESGRPVISDRYSDSRYAYQGVTLADRSDVEDPVTFVQSIHEPWTVVPDLTIYLDLPPEIAAERSGVTNKFEHAETLTEVRANYERLVDADPERFVRVDATQPPAAVERAVRDHVTDALS
jgi:dTMP kinase